MNDEPRDHAAVVEPDEISEALTILTTFAWCVSPARIVLELTLATEALSLQFLTRHPEHRASVLARLQSMVTTVAAASSTSSSSEVH
jgi:hypothetical protein